MGREGMLDRICHQCLAAAKHLTNITQYIDDIISDAERNLLTALLTHYQQVNDLSTQETHTTKPIKLGFKIWVIADCLNGYFCDFIPYVGTCLGLGKKKVVLELTQPLFGRNHQVFCDNYFTTTPLFRTLLNYQAIRMLRASSDPLTLATDLKTIKKALLGRKYPSKLICKTSSKVYRRMSAQYGSSCWIFPKPFQFQNDITVVVKYTKFLKLFLSSTV